VVITTIPGGYEIAAMHDGYRVHRRYFGYTKREATSLFRRVLTATH